MIKYNYKFSIAPEEIDTVINEITKDNPGYIGIDTETNGLDPQYSTAYQTIVGWEVKQEDGSLLYKHYVIETPDRKAAAPYINKLLVSIRDKLKVFHNASYDIKILQNYDLSLEMPTKPFFCTLIAIAHVTKLETFGLKQLADILKLRSVFPHLEAIWNEFSSVQSLNDKADIIQRALDNGDLPDSSPVINNISKLRAGVETKYFDMLFNKPDGLRDFYAEKLTEKVKEEFAVFAKKNFSWDLSMTDTFLILKDVYSVGPTFDRARTVMKAFNETKGFKNEWVRWFKTKMTTLTTVSFEELNKIDRAAMTLYAGMDVKLTLDLFRYLQKQMAETNFDADSQRILQMDFDVLDALHMQERVGFKLDTKYIEESMQKSKQALLKINTMISNKLDYLISTVSWEGKVEEYSTATETNNEIIHSNEQSWKEETGLGKEEILQANNYNIYNKIFEMYLPFFPLPAYVDPKSENKLTTIKKFTTTVEYLIRGSAPNATDLEKEMYEKFVSVNGEGKVKILIGNINNVEEGDEMVGGTYIELFNHMLAKSKSIVESRTEEIKAAEAIGKKLKYRADEQAIIDIFEDAKKVKQDIYQPLWFINQMNERVLSASKQGVTAVKSDANKFLAGRNIKIVPVKRTINADTTIALIKTDVAELPITDEQKALAQEAKEIIKLKAKESSLLKWIGTYQIKLLAMYGQSPDDRIRSTYLLHNVVTGRLSTDIHQFPKKPMMDMFTAPDAPKEILYSPRHAFLAEAPAEWGEDALLVYEDFSQMELRVAAEYTLRANMPDVPLLRAYIPFNCKTANGEFFDIEKHKLTWTKETWFLNEAPAIKWEPTDLHLAPVKVAFPHYFDEDGHALKEYAELVAALRNACKSVNFGKIYGSGLNGILNNKLLVDFDKKDLTAIYEAQEKTYVNLKLFQKHIMDNIKKDGYVRNLMGRKYIKGFPYMKNTWGKGSQYQYAYRGVNYIVQGESACALKSRMIAIHKFLKENNYKTVMLQNIHDEVAFLVPVSEKHLVFKLQELMQDIKEWKINMVSDVEVSATNWGEKLEAISDADVDAVIEGRYTYNNQKDYKEANWK